MRETIRLGQYKDHGHADSDQVLLVRQIPIHGHEHVKLGPRATQQLAVEEACPAVAADRLDLVAGKLRSKVNRQGLVKKDAH